MGMSFVLYNALFDPSLALDDDTIPNAKLCLVSDFQTKMYWDKTFLTERGALAVFLRQIEY